MSLHLHVMHVPRADPARDSIVATLVSQGRACVHPDPHRRGLMQTWMGALGHAAAKDTRHEWSVILSDDAAPAGKDWLEELAGAVANSPEPILGLTHFGGYGVKAVEKGVPYVVGPNLVWGGAIAYHRDALRPLYSWASRVLAIQDYPHDDVLVSEFSKLIGHRDALCARAVFDQPIERSLLGHGGRVRRPATTISTHPGPAWDATPRTLRFNGRPPAGRLPKLTGVIPPEVP